MNKVKYIIKREYLSRVRKKSFLLMTIIGPLLFAGLIAAPAWLATMEDSGVKQIAVVDSSGIFDYTKILNKSITLNSNRYYSELKTRIQNLPALGKKIETLNNQLQAITQNKDTLLGKSLQREFYNQAKTIKRTFKINNPLFDSISNKYANILPLINNRLEETCGKISNTTTAKFHYTNLTETETKIALTNEDYYAVIYIPKNILTTLTIQIKSTKALSMGLRSHIQSSIERSIETQKMIEAGIDKEMLDGIKTRITVLNKKITKEGEEEQARPEIAMILGYVSGFLIYISIFMFGAQIMRGVIEEKTSRIVEVILSSVKPRELMLGKIFGVGLVGLTQYLIWIIMTAALSFAAFTFLIPSDVSVVQTQAQNFMDSTGGMQTAVPVVENSMSQIQGIIHSLMTVNWPLVIGAFIFFFIGGYMLYSALFAAIGSAVDNESDTQQFMAPITLPLILGMLVMINTINNPESAMAYWFSIIPFTSPIVMIVRIPFGVPIGDLILSATLLIITFIFITWIAAKIYKTGILMYGSKVSYKEIWKWIRIKN